jgi:hypothetical protein
VQAAAAGSNSHGSSKNGSTYNGNSSSSSHADSAALGTQQLTGSEIMKHLKAASSWQELQQLVQQHSQQLNWRHSSALITHLAQLTKRQQQQVEKQQQRQWRRQQQQQQCAAHLQQQVMMHPQAGEQQQQQQHLGGESVQESPEQPGTSNRSNTSSRCNSSSSSAALHDPGLQLFVASIMPLMDSHMQQYDVRGLANTVWALARLQPAAIQQPSRAWLERFCATSQPLLHQFDAQQLSNALWGLLQLQHTPPDAWLQSWFAAFAAALHDSSSSSSVSLQALSSAVWCVTQLQNSSSSSSRPPPDWLDQVLLAAATGLQEAARNDSSSSGSSSQAVSNLLWSCAQLQHAPPRQLLDAVQAWLQQLAAAPALPLQQLSNQSLANSLWAVAKLAQLQQQQVQGISAAAALHGSVSSDGSESQCTEEHSSSDRDSMGSMGAGSRARSSTSVEAAALLQQCGDLVLQLTLPRLQLLNGQHLSNMVWAAGALQLQPSRSWLLGVQQLLQANAASYQDQQVANILWGLSRLVQQQVQQQQQVLLQGAVQQLLAVQQQQLPGYSSQALSSSLLSVARLGLRVPEPCLQAWLKEVARRNYLSAAGGQSMTDSCCALAMVRRHEEAAAAAAAAKQASGTGSSSRNSSSVSGRGVMQLRSITSSSSSRASLSFGFQHSFDSEWLTGFCTASGSRLGSFSGDQLAGLGWAMAALWFRPPVPWLLSWHAALAGKAASMSGEAASKALWALQRLPSGPQGASKEAAAAQLVAAAVAAAAAADAPGAGRSGIAPHSLAVAACCTAALGRSSSSAVQARSAVQQLLQAMPRLLGSCSSQQLLMVLSAAAAVQAPLPPLLMPAVLQRLQQLAQQRRLDSRGAATAVAAVARLSAAVASSSSTAEQPQHQQQQQRRRRFRPPEQWTSSMLQQFSLQLAGPSDLSYMLWALAALGYSPGRAWLQSWTQHSQQQLQGFTPTQLASSAWGFTVLRYRPNPSWLAAWVQGAGLQAAAATPGELALTLYAAAALRCEVGRAWLQQAALLTAGSIRRWSLRDLAMGLWGLARLGVRAVADAELLEVLLGHMVAATAAGGLQQLSPHHQLQLLQAAVLLRQPTATEAAQGCERPLPATSAAQQQQYSKSAVRRMRWRAKTAAEQAAAAADAARVALQQQQQQQRLLAQLQHSPGSSAAPSAAAVQDALATWEEAAAGAAVAASAAQYATTGRSPDAVGLPVEQAWLLLWCKASLQQMRRWQPSMAAAVLSAAAALGGASPPPAAWQQQVLQQVVRQARRRRLLQKDADVITRALQVLRSPLLGQWLSHVQGSSQPADAAAAAAGEQEQVMQQQQLLRVVQRPQRRYNASAVSRVQYPRQLSGSALLQLRRQHRTVRLTGWWKRQQQLQQQRLLQRQWRSAAAAEGARSVWRPAPPINGHLGSYPATPGSSSMSNVGSPGSSVDGATVPVPSSLVSSPSPGSSVGSNIGPSLEGRKLSSSMLVQRPVRYSQADGGSGGSSSNDGSSDSSSSSSSSGDSPSAAAGKGLDGVAAGSVDDVSTAAAAAQPRPDSNSSSEGLEIGQAASAAASNVVASSSVRLNGVSAAVVQPVWSSFGVAAPGFNAASATPGVAAARVVEGHLPGGKQQHLSWACRAD